MSDEKVNEKETPTTTAEAEPANANEKPGGLGEKEQLPEADEREKAATKGRSKSPTKTVNTTSSRHTNSNHGHHGRDASNATSANSRRNRVSVGNRVSRVVVVRPPYAARDELDFERRPRSNTAGTVTGAGNAQGSRHLGIQPTLHAKSQSEQPSNSNQGQNPDVRITETSGQQATPQENDLHLGQNQNGSLTRPANPDRMPSNDASRWLAFTIPTRYRKRYDDYMAQRAKEQEEEERKRKMGESAVDSSSADSENSSYYTDSEEEGADGVRQHSRRRKKPNRSQTNPKRAPQYVRGAKPSGRKGEYPAQTDEEADIGRYLSTRPHHHGSSRRSSKRKEHKHPSGGDGNIPETPQQGLSRSSSFNRHTMTARIDGGLSANQSGTPGWNTPWRPDGGRRNTRPVNHIHRVQSDLGFEGLGGSHARFNNDSGQAGPGQDQHKKKKKRTRFTAWKSWMVRSAFAPLILRLFNIAFTASILGIAVNIHRTAHRSGIDGIMGSSTLYAIIVMPLSLVHIFFNIYAEYFGPPIGVWRVRGKMFYTFTELIFICLWSALLSLAFDDLFTSVAGCTSYTPNAQFKEVPIGSSGAEGSIADRLCDNQTALIALVFVGMILYVLVLIVSLFRIFAKISRFN